MTRSSPADERPVFAGPLQTPRALFRGPSASSGGGIRTRDLRVMSPTSYQTAPPRVGTDDFSSPSKGLARALAGEEVLAAAEQVVRMRDRDRGSEGSDAAVRVAVVDIGTNSTRLLIADVDEN